MLAIQNELLMVCREEGTGGEAVRKAGYWNLRANNNDAHDALLCCCPRLHTTDTRDAAVLSRSKAS